MNITLEKTLVDKLDFRRILSKSNKIHRKFDVSYIVQSVEDCDDKFAITFDVLVHNSILFKMRVTYTAIFKTSERFKEDFLKSDFARINAPAIAYPFLRSYVSFITLNSGYEPALLPTINFVEFSEVNFK